MGFRRSGLARQLQVPQGEARDYITAYFERFPGINPIWKPPRLPRMRMGMWIHYLGGRLYISGITSPNQAQRGFAERQAINAPIQGTAADIIKLAMVRMPAAIADSG